MGGRSGCEGRCRLSGDRGGVFGEIDFWRRRDGDPGSFVCRTKAGAWLALNRTLERAVQAAVPEEPAALIKHINNYWFINRRLLKGCGEGLSLSVVSALWTAVDIGTCLVKPP